MENNTRDRKLVERKFVSACLSAVDLNKTWSGDFKLDLMVYNKDKRSFREMSIILKFKYSNFSQEDNGRDLFTWLCGLKYLLKFSSSSKLSLEYGKSNVEEAFKDPIMFLDNRLRAQYSFQIKDELITKIISDCKKLFRLDDSFYGIYPTDFKRFSNISITNSVGSVYIDIDVSLEDYHSFGLKDIINSSMFDDNEYSNFLIMSYVSYKIKKEIEILQNEKSKA